VTKSDETMKLALVFHFSKAAADVLSASRFIRLSYTIRGAGRKGGEIWKSCK
jgi:hypothetical protein